VSLLEHGWAQIDRERRARHERLLDHNWKEALHRQLFDCNVINTPVTIEGRLLRTPGWVTYGTDQYIALHVASPRADTRLKHEIFVRHTDLPDLCDTAHRLDPFQRVRVECTKAWSHEFGYEVLFCETFELIGAPPLVLTPHTPHYDPFDCA
jgi:hypothetical protein